MRLTLVLTHQCNLACSYCYAGEKFNRKMSDETAEKALKLAFETPSDEPITVSFFGGEPLLEFDRMERWTRRAFEMAQERGRDIEFSVTTNATIVSDKILAFFQSYPFRVALSVDGLAEAHDVHRPFVSGRGSGELIWRNLERFIEALPTAQVLSVVSPETVEGLPAMIERLHRMGYQSVSLLPNVDTEWNQAAREKARRGYEGAAAYCFASFEGDRPIWVSPFSDYIGIPSSQRGCGFGQQDVAVAPTGNLYPCARLVGTDVREDVRIGQVDEGLDLAQVKKIRARVKAKLVGCGVEDQCGCTAVMPGDSLPQLNHLAFFRETAQDICSHFGYGQPERELTPVA